MGAALAVYVPLLAFMLVPVWIPLVAVAVGSVADRLRPQRTSATLAAVQAAKARSAVLHGSATVPLHAADPVSLPRRRAAAVEIAA